MAIATTTAQEIGAFWRELCAEDVPVDLVNRIVERAAFAVVDDGFRIDHESLGAR